jgi:peptidoglycan hydrolase-like protein with peptidoglycan-binding domain
MSRRSIAAVARAATLTLVVAACSPGGTAEVTVTTVAPESTTTTTLVPATTTTTLPPGGPPLIRDGDNNQTVAAFQWLLTCTGYGNLTADGNYGSATGEAIRTAQTALGKEANGEPDEEVLAALSRACSQSREIEDAEEPLTIIGNAAVGDPEVFTIELTFAQTLTVTVDPPELDVSLRGSDGVPVVPDETTGAFSPGTSGTFELLVNSFTDPTTFTMQVAVTDSAAEAAWIINTRSITYDGNRIELGDGAEDVLEQVFEYLGHGVRGQYDEFDTGWYTITDPVDNGIRGVFVGGLAFLFFGPHPADPDAPEILVRIRYEGSLPDAEGDERPPGYVATPLGITVGNTLADLKVAYGSSVNAGSNASEHYYRYTEAGGELCFYFGDSTPTDSSEILEIATECRS